MRKTNALVNLVGICMALISGAASAQQITYSVLATSVPTLSEYGMIGLSILMVLAGLVYLKITKGNNRRVVSYLLVSAGAALVVAQSDVISNAWAVLPQVWPISTRSSPVLLENGEGIYPITNDSGSSIKITALVNGNSCTVSPYANSPSYTPACNVDDVVAPGGKCHVRVNCDA